MAKTDFFNRYMNIFEGFEKGEIRDLVDDNVYHIEQVRILNGEKGEFAQFTVKEIEGKFFNGSNPVSEILIEARDNDMLDVLPEVGWKFRVGKSKQWNTEYVAMSAVK